MKIKISIVITVLMIFCYLGATQKLVYAQDVNTQSFNKICASISTTVALKNDGTVWTWGSYYNTPFQANELTDIISLSAGSTANLVLKNDGTVWAWGDNYYGQLGNGTTNSNYNNEPVQVRNLTDVISVSASDYYSMALKKDGTVWVWGDNKDGCLTGNDKNSKVSIPVKINGLFNVIAIATGGAHRVVLKKDGTVWAWGNNSSGQLGENGGYTSKIPVKVKGLTDVKSVAAGGMHTIALKNNGTVWTWGSNWQGQLGNDLEGFSEKPVQVKGLINIKNIAAGCVSTAVVKSDGTVWEWGSRIAVDKDYYAIRNSIPVQVKDLTDMVSVSTGVSHSAALKNDGTVWSWGNNKYGQLGDGTNIDVDTPTKSLINLGFEISENPMNLDDKNRISGIDRYATAVEVSKCGWNLGSKYAIIVNGENYPDAISSSVLAKKYESPILLTYKESLTPSTKIELIRLGVTDVFIVGGPAVVSTVVENSIRNLNIKVSRLYGSNRYDTCSAVINSLGNFGNFIAVVDKNFSDALTACNLSNIYNFNIVLTSGSYLPDSIKDITLKSIPKGSYYFNSTDSGMVDNIFTGYGATSYILSDKYDRSNSIFAHATQGSKENELVVNKNFSNGLLVASADNFADALAASSLANKEHKYLLLVKSTLGISEFTLSEYKKFFRLFSDIKVIGGQGAISDDVLNTYRN